MKMNLDGMPINIFFAPDPPSGGGVTDPPAGTPPPDTTPPAGGVTTPPAAMTTGTFKDQLPENLRVLKSIEDIGSIEDLVNSHDHAQRMIGKTRVEVPGADGTPEQWNDYYKSAGRPDGEKGAGYSLFEGDAPKMPDGLNRDEKMEEWFKEKCFNRGLSQSQTRGMYEDYIEMQGGVAKGAVTTNQEQLATWDAQIKKDFGQAYEQNVDLARQAVTKLGTPEFVDMLNKTGLTNHPEMIKFCHQIGAMTSEHSGAPGAGPGSTTVLTPEQARGEITRLQSDPAFMKNYTSQSNPEAHKEALEKMQKYFAMAHPQTEE